MKWTYAIKNKLAAIGILAVMFIMLIMVSISERQTSNGMTEAANNIFDDRVIAQAYIFKYAQIANQLDEMFHKENQIQETELQEKILLSMAKVNEINAFYLKTYLTPEEKERFSELTTLFNSVNYEVENGNLPEAHNYIKETMVVLEGLNDLQVREAGNQISTIKKLSSVAHLNSNFQISILLIGGLIIHALIFSQKSIEPKFIQKAPNLN